MVTTVMKPDSSNKSDFLPFCKFGNLSSARLGVGVLERVEERTSAAVVDFDGLCR